jgi:hypothetical protein
MTDYTSRLRPLRIGLLAALLSIVFGWGLGGVFGAAEASVKGTLAASAEAASDVYGGDVAAADKVVKKSWSYMKRAHLHGGVLGASAVALILLLAALGPATKLTSAASGALGLGAIGYGTYWMLAGFKAPGMGSTGAAKESLDWLAVPSAGALFFGLGVVVFLTVKTLFLARDE